jgi:hypothetical protein
MSTAFKMTLVTLALVGVATAYFIIKDQSEFSQEVTSHQGLEAMKQTGNIEVKSSENASERFKAWREAELKRKASAQEEPAQEAPAQEAPAQEAPAQKEAGSTVAPEQE